jgi:molecular chaperone DnaK
VDVTFLVDANGLLTVSAVERRSGQQAAVTVQPQHGLTQDEVEKLVLDSVAHAHDDFTMRRLIELKNKANADLRHARRALAEAGSQLTAQQRQRIDAATATLEAAMAGTDADALHRAAAAFGDATLPLAEMLMNAVVNAALKGKAAEQLDARTI